MARKLSMQWNLRQLMAAKGLFQTSELIPLLEERDVHLSRQYVHRLVTKPPQRVNIELLAALCDILGCTAADLLEFRIEEVRELRHVAGDTGPGIGELRPIRATIRRPHEPQ
ncbi:hypothetical protein AHiyo8_25480 [Arthrobacter sp. Hiyo8]|jgi:DNA-binding Xre family transcriptional regulator|uniref:XRE family transcriptional regulator n=2 Tax=Arthrobacter terricola TaxID=2547396 RepID=A0A4R5KA93_9MICC|nr:MULTISPECIES: helix-turn-helix transcriptional regulator [Arthrobacter]MBT8162720.1 helix-turn-helix transcriptional regulator [Arthrobacter sp. GN70]TDF92113.1 XRE family transcriptional regulator [Arthrobacter terricola]BAS14245.1 hypothetical protein AHiyo8_25480 [Arthrobacter sp. Hiyo8]GAP58789.1 hypothetical protein AHiyo1_19290 [Arthrobacter sp. Hiyo1]